MFVILRFDYLFEDIGEDDGDVALVMDSFKRGSDNLNLLNRIFLDEDDNAIWFRSVYLHADDPDIHEWIFGCLLYTSPSPRDS